MELMKASNEWATRPMDQRFISLFDLDNRVQTEKANSAQKVISTRKLRAVPDATDSTYKGLLIEGPNGSAVAPTHWSFGQLATLGGAPAGYLRDLPAPLAADCVNYGLHVARNVDEVGVLLTRSEDGSPNRIRAATGPNYGRIWNADISGVLVDRFGDGVSGDWKVPGEWGKAVTVTKENTTLYASDRDMFVFLADEQNRIELPNRRNGETGSLARGFFVWNSEVGSGTAGIAMFLFDFVCGNRIVWGAREYKEIKIRHTSGAPDRWADELAPVLKQYRTALASPVESMLKAAQAQKVDNLQSFLNSRFTKAESNGIIAAHEAEESRPMESLWDIATGVTAFAKSVKWQDDRIKLERSAGAILDLVAA